MVGNDGHENIERPVGYRGGVTGVDGVLFRSPGGYMYQDEAVRNHQGSAALSAER